MPDANLFIIGATTRATVEMACRAGYNPGSFDVYNDQDLACHAAFLQQIHFCGGTPSISPADFQSIVGQTPWLYTGPLENDPAWLEAASQSTNLWGNTAAANRALRDIFKLNEVIQSQKFEIAMPETRPSMCPPAKLSDWLFKPLQGTGGWNIVEARKWQSAKTPSQVTPTAGYLQKRIQGISFGATIASDTNEAVVLGICRSFNGVVGRPFAYSGSEGPISSHAVQKLVPELTRLARLLCRTFKLQGLWNIDLVYMPRKHQWYLLEVNPRPSASMEVLELASGVSIFKLHSMIFEGRHEWLGLAKQSAEKIASASLPVRKKIVYAKKNFRATAESIPKVETDIWCPGRFSDLPYPGSIIEAGEPIMTWIFESDLLE